MDANETSISAGLIIGDILAEDPGVAEIVTEVFPVVIDTATLPYVSYKCVKAEFSPVKGVMGADTLLVDVCCFSETYAGSVALAEKVRAALDGRQARRGNLVMRSCFLSDREEAWEDDAFVQRLQFTVKI